MVITFEESNPYLILRALFTVVASLAMMASLTEFRFPRKKLLKVLALYLCWVVLSNAVLLPLLGIARVLQIFLFTVTIPAVLLTYWAAKDSPAQAIFNYASQCVFSLLLAAAIHLVVARFGLPMWADMLLRCGLYLPLIYLEWRFLRGPFRRLIAILPDRWDILMPIPCAFCFYLVFIGVWPQTWVQNSAQAAYLFLGLGVMAVVYFSLFRSLMNQYRFQQAQQNAALLAAQVSALRQRLQAAQAAEDALRIARHDMRHSFAAAAALVEQGDIPAALQLLGRGQQSLADAQINHWCQDPVLDAVLALYFQRAEEQGIALETELSFPPEIPVDTSELGMVFANALENAIEACLALPLSQRRIRCKVIHHPRFMLQIANPFSGQISFDAEGLPLPQRPGHGTGVLSIASFCRKNGASCYFTAENGWFILRMILGAS